MITTSRLAVDALHAAGIPGEQITVIGPYEDEVGAVPGTAAFLCTLAGLLAKGDRLAALIHVRIAIGLASRLKDPRRAKGADDVPKRDEKEHLARTEPAPSQADWPRVMHDGQASCLIAMPTKSSAAQTLLR
jgi:hypothetical protein